MNDLSITVRLDHDTVVDLYDVVTASNSSRHRHDHHLPAAYRPIGLLDGLNAYAAVLGCSGHCTP